MGEPRTFQPNSPKKNKCVDYFFGVKKYVPGLQSGHTPIFKAKVIHALLLNKRQ